MRKGFLRQEEDSDLSGMRGRRGFNGEEKEHFPEGRTCSPKKKLLWAIRGAKAQEAKGGGGDLLKKKGTVGSSAGRETPQ